MQVDIQARKLYLEFALMTLDSDETSRDFETGVLHRISSRVYLAEWFGLGSHFGKKCLFGPYFPKLQWSFLKNTFSKNDFAPTWTGSL